jgi:predicted  nucleic acid-binding Zn-ribbon protein
MKWISTLTKRSTTDMTNRQSKEKSVKQTQKEIEKLRDEYQKMEFRPCHGDLDLIQKDKDLGSLKEKINELEKELDTYLYSWSH